MKSSRIRELYKQYEGAFEPWRIRLAIARLRHFKVPLEMWEDVMQELAIAIHRFRFDPARAHAASEQTILCRVLDRRIKMLARSSARRAARLERFSQMTQQEEDTHLPEDDASAREVRAVVAELTPKQQVVCRLLAEGDSMFVIAERLGVHYETVRRSVRHIREAFSERGFDQWFE